MDQNLKQKQMVLSEVKTRRFGLPPNWMKVKKKWLFCLFVDGFLLYSVNAETTVK